MDKQLPEPKGLNLGRFTNFIVIFLIVFLSQIPGCVVVIADDAGQIDSSKHEKLIQFATATFMFPLRLFLNAFDSWLILVYVSNIILLSCFVFFLIFIWKKVKKRML
jgi:hypothetical protein